MTTDDMELVRQYAAHQSESAFAALVSRHAGLVYSVALRRVGDPQLAEEVTQAVFIILARKAGSLNDKTILPGWLYRATCYTANSALKREYRRQRREQEAFMQSTIHEAPTEAPWEQISPLLEEAMLRLGQADRDALVLRFFEGRSLQEVGMASGASEDAAKKRVNRALEKLRRYFTKRGVVLTTAIMAGAVAANSVQAAPVAVINSVTAVALAKGAAASGSTLTLIKGALKLMAWTKMKMAVVVGVGVLLTAGTTTITIKEIQAHRTYPWQVAHGNSDEGVKALNTAPPQVTMVRSKFTTHQGQGSLVDDLPPQDQWRFIGIHSTPAEIIKRAYWDGDMLLPSQIILSPGMPDGFYDYIANLNHGSQPALQALVRKKFGLVGKYELREMDVLLLEVDHPHAPGLKSVTTLPPDQPRPLTAITHGIIHYKNVPISRLVMVLAQDLQIPVMDQTGLMGNYDLDVPDMPAPAPAEQIEKIKQTLLDECGLKLVPGREPTKVLVVEKTR